VSTPVVDIPFDVFWKAGWADEWIPLPHAEVRSVELNVADSLSEAEVLLRYGRIKWDDAETFADVPATTLMNAFLRIDHDGDRIFTGFVVRETLKPRAPRDPEGDPVDQGDLVAFAHGMEYFLDFFPVHQTFVFDRAAAGAQDQRKPIRRVIPFNEPARFDRPGNRSEATVSFSDAPLQDATFHAFHVDGKPWNALQILKYVLASFWPVSLPIRLTGETNILEQHEPRRFDPSALRPRQIISRLVDRRRGATWAVRVDDNDEITLHVASTLPQAITAGDLTLPANSEPVTFNVDVGPFQTDVTIDVDSGPRYDKIRVMGRPVQSMCTLRLPKQHMIPSWSTADEQAYLAADQEDRESERFRHVFTEFVVAEGVTLDQLGANPGFTDAGDFDESVQPINRAWGLRFLPRLPMKEPLGETPEQEPADDEEDGATFLAPFAVCWDPDAERYRLSDRMGEQKRSYRLTLLDDQEGVRLTAVPQHAAAREEAPPELNAEVDWAQHEFTLAFETDERPGVIVDLASNPLGRDLVIDVPDAEFWWRAGGTVIGVNTDGQLELSGSGEPLRDDTPRLKQIATLARAWYGTNRAALTINEAGILKAVRPGNLVTSAATGTFTEDINSIVTSILYDGVNQTTTVQTAFENLDPTAFF